MTPGVAVGVGVPVPVRVEVPEPVGTGDTLALAPFVWVPELVGVTLAVAAAVLLTVLVNVACTDGDAWSHTGLVGGRATPRKYVPGAAA